MNKYLLAPAAEEKRKAEQAYAQGHTSEAVGHTVAEYLPVIGPIASHIGERAGTGDLGGALAEGGTYALAPKAAEKVLPVIRGTRDFTRGFVKGAFPAEPEVIPERAAPVRTHGLPKIGESAPSVEKPTYSAVSDENSTTHSVNAGKMRLEATEFKEQPDVLTVTTSDAGSAKGTGAGFAAYKELAEQAAKQGKELRSGGSVGEQAQADVAKVWNRLKQAGFNVQGNVDEGFSIPAPKAEAVAPATETAPSLSRLEEQLNKGLGGKPLKPGVSLREQLTSTAEPKARTQFEAANGSDLDAAITKEFPETKEASAVREKIHNLSNVELRQLAINLGEDLGQSVISRAKQSGAIPRSDIFKRLLENNSAADISKAIESGQHLPNMPTPKASAAGAGAEASPSLKELWKREHGEAGPKGTIGEPWGNVGKTTPQRITPAKLTQEIESEPGYVYHATNAERLQEIANDGQLRVHKPSHGTDQDTWPDGSTEKRAYFTSKANTAWQFAPEEGTPVAIRVKGTGLKVESTGDYYSKAPIKSDQLEFLGKDGDWHPVDSLRDQPLSPAEVKARRAGVMEDARKREDQFRADIKSGKVKAPVGERSLAKPSKTYATSPEFSIDKRTGSWNITEFPESWGKDDLSNVFADAQEEADSTGKTLTLHMHDRALSTFEPKPTVTGPAKGPASGFSEPIRPRAISEQSSVQPVRRTQTTRQALLEKLKAATEKAERAPWRAKRGEGYKKTKKD